MNSASEFVCSSSRKENYDYTGLGLIGGSAIAKGR